MPPSNCPSCRSHTLRKLDAPSEHAAVNYYRCAKCGRVWTTAKADSGKITHITELPTKKP